MQALVDERRLPAVICGASAGAVVAAVACTRSDDELRTIMHERASFLDWR